MRLEYKNILIRNVVPEDAEKLLSWWNDGEVMAHAGFPNGLGTSLEKIREQIENYTDDNRVLMIVVDGVEVGEMNYKNIGRKEVDIGIKICDQSYQNKGYGKIILTMFIKELFRMGFKKIVLDTNLENKRAQKVYEKLGFKKARTNFNTWKGPDGKFMSTIDYELVEEDFNKFW